MWVDPAPKNQDRFTSRVDHLFTETLIKAFILHHTLRNCMSKSQASSTLAQAVVLVLALALALVPVVTPCCLAWL